MEKVKIEINKNAISNLITFLDRVEIKGIQEISAMNEILSIFMKENTPAKEGDK